MVLYGRPGMSAIWKGLWDRQDAIGPIKQGRGKVSNSALISSDSKTLSGLW